MSETKRRELWGYAKEKEYFFIGLCCFLFLSGCGEKQVEKEVELGAQEGDISYVTVQATYEDIVLEKPINCTYRQSVQHDLAFGLDNYMIEFIDVKEDDMVEAGQLLSALEMGDVKEELKDLEYILACSQLKLQQVKEEKEYELNAAYILFSYGKKEQKDKDALKEEQEAIEKQYRDVIQDLEDQVAVDTARVETTKELLEKGQLLAPADGMVTYVLTRPEDIFREHWEGADGTETGEEIITNTGIPSVADQTIITISDLEGCYFACYTTEYMDYFEEGAVYQVVCKEGDNEVRYAVTPIHKENWAENEYMEFALTDETELIKIGTVGTLYLNVGEKKNVLCLPENAIHTSEDKSFVYVLKDGIRQMQYVEVGLSGNGKTEILSGLTEEEQVVLNQALSTEDSSGEDASKEEGAADEE